MHQSNSLRLVRGDHFSRQAKLVGKSLSAQSRQALRASITRQDSQLYFRLAQPGCLAREPNRTGKRQFAAAAQRESINRADRGLADCFEQMKHSLSEPRKILSANGSLFCR